MLLLLARRIRFQQIDGWCNARPVLKRLGQMRRMDRCLICELGDALGDGEYAGDLRGRQLELPYRRRQQALACSIQRVGRSWPAACFRRASDHVLVGFTTPPASVGHALLGATLGGFNDQVGRECSLKGGSALPGDEHLGATPAGEVGVTGVPANTRGRDIGGHDGVTADTAKGEGIGQCGTAAQKRDRMVAGQRTRDGAALVLLAGNGVQP